VGKVIAVPSFNPLQVISVELAFGKISKGVNIVMVSFIVHKESSVIIIN